jgi:hypothetical protein
MLLLIESKFPSFIFDKLRFSKTGKNEVPDN